MANPELIIFSLISAIVGGIFVPIVKAAIARARAKEDGTLDMAKRINDLKVTDELREVMTDMLRDLERQREKAMSDLDKMTRQADYMRGRLQEEANKNATLSAEIHTLEAQLRVTNAKLEETLHRLEATLEKLRQAELEIKRLRESLARAYEHIAELESKIGISNGKK